MLNAYLENTLVYDPSLCNGCGMCVDVCPHGTFEMNGRLAMLVRPQSCMECGACQVNCITGAIHVESGVGCASAMIMAALKGQKEVSCGGDDSCCS
jgi:ferredoxin